MEENIYKIINISPLADFNSEEVQKKVNIQRANLICKIAKNERDVLIHPEKKDEYQESIDQTRKAIKMIDEILLDDKKRTEYNEREDIKQYIELKKFTETFPKRVEEVLKSRISEPFYIMEISTSEPNSWDNIPRIYIKIFKLTDKWIEFYYDAANRLGENSVKGGGYRPNPGTTYLDGSEYGGCYGLEVAPDNMKNQDYIKDQEKYGFHLNIPDAVYCSSTIGSTTNSRFLEDFEKKHNIPLIRRKISGYRGVKERRLLSILRISKDFYPKKNKTFKEQQEEFLSLLGEIKEIPTQDRIEESNSERN